MKKQTLIDRLLLSASFFLGGTLVALLYWNGLYGEFFFDDEVNILLPESIQMTELSLRSFYDALRSGVASPTGRPIAQLSFALNHFFTGFDPFAFKATNLAIHLINGLLIYFISRRLLQSGLIAGFAAMLWLLHPIQLTSVLYVVQRMTSLSTLFILAGFLLHIIGREQGGRKGGSLMFLAWFVCWPLSMLSKEIGVLFPLFILLWETILRRSETKKIGQFARYLAIAIGLVLISGFVYMVVTRFDWLLSGYTVRDFSLTERLLTEGRVLWLYIGLITLPELKDFALHHDDILLSTSFLSPWTTLPSLLGLASIVWLAWRVRFRAPLLSFGIAWFLIGHSLESTALALEIAHEHRNYLPSFGLVIIAAWALASVTKYSGWQKTASISLAIGITASFAITTALRAHQFGDELRRSQIETEYHPRSARAQYEAANAIISRLVIPDGASPRYYFARTHYEKAGQLDPNFKENWLGLIHLNCLVKKPVENEWIDELAKRLHNTTFGPKDRNILYSVKEMAIAGTLCLSRDEIETLFNAATMNPGLTPFVEAILHSWLADYLTLAASDLPAAQSALSKSLAIAPNNSSNLLKLAQLALLQGQKDDARKALDKLDDAPLTRPERNTINLLLNCLDASKSVQCSVE